MKTALFGIALIFSTTSAFASITIHENLKPEDQKYYKNEAFDGQNQLERIDSTVKEINKLHGMIESLRNEVNALKAEVQELKSKK